MTQRNRFLLGVGLVACTVLALVIYWKLTAPRPSPVQTVRIQQQAQPVPVAEEPVPAPEEEPPPPAEPEPVAIKAVPAALAGIVVEATNDKPVSKADILVELCDPHDVLKALHKEPWSHTSTSGDDGRFSVDVPTPGVEYVVVAMASGFERASAVRRVAEEGVDDVRLRLVRLCSVSGRVVDAQGNPVANMVVGADHGKSDPPQPSIHYSPTTFSEPTGPDGAFMIADLEKGYCVLTATAKPVAGLPAYGMDVLGAMPEDMGLVIQLAQAEHREGVELRLGGESNRYVIAGIVQNDQGGPVPGAKIWSGDPLISRKPDWSGAATGVMQIRGVASNPTDERGRFRLDSVNAHGMGSDGGIIKRPVCLCCEAKGFEPAYVPDVPLGTQDVVITLQPRRRGEITGVVLDSRTRRPVAAAQVMIMQVYTDWGDRQRASFNDTGMKTDENGHFAFQDVPAGDVTLQAAHSAYGVSLHRADIHVIPNQATRIELLLDPPGALEVEAIAADQAIGKRDGKPSCSIDLVATDVLTVEDARPWDYSYGARDYRNPSLLPVGGEYNISRMYAVAAQRQSGQDGWQKVEDGHWKGTLRLPPGNYTVTAEYNPGAMGGVSYCQTGKASVSEGRTARLRFDFGGSSAIRCTIPGLEGEEGLFYLILTRPADTAVLPDTGPANFDYFATSLKDASQMAVLAACRRSPEFLFSALPSGDYTLSAYGVDPRSGDMRLTARRDVSIAQGQEYEMELPLTVPE